MTKLRTLKDLNPEYDDQDNCGYTWNIGDVDDELCTMAEEWIEFFDKNEPNEFDPDGYKSAYIKDWIKRFFNLEKK